MRSKPWWTLARRVAVDARVTAALFVACLLLFGVGIAVPQTPLAAPAQIDAFATRWPTLAAIVRATGLDDVYHSPWMYAVYLVFTVQLLTYLIRRLRTVVSDARLALAGSPVDLPRLASVEGDSGQLTVAASALRKRRYRVRAGDGELMAVRNRWSPLWGLAFHASFILLLAGAWQLRTSRLNGVALLTEGQVFHGRPVEFDVLDPPGAASEDLPSFGFAVEAIAPVFSSAGSTTDIVVRLRRENGAVDELRVNEPVAFADVDVLIRNFGVAPVFSVWEGSGPEARRSDVFSPRLICWSPGLPEDSFRLESPAATAVARFLPDFARKGGELASRSMTRRDPVLSLRIQPDDDEPGTVEALLRVGDVVRVGGSELRLEEFRTWGEFLFSRRAGTLLLIGFLLMVVGSAFRLLMPRRQIGAVVRSDAGGARIDITGRADLFPVGLGWEIDELRAAIARSEHGRSRRQEAERDED